MNSGAGTLSVTLWPGWQRAVEAVIVAGQRAARRGWLPATSGNLSVRADDSQIAVTRSGVDKGQLLASDLLRQPIEAPLIRGSSAEAALHQRLYRDQPAVGAVFHTHSLAATVLGRSRSGHDYIELSGWELQKALDGVRSHETVLHLPVFSNTQDIDALADAVARRFAAPDGQRPLTPGYLIAGHGLYAWGNSPEQAWNHLEALDTLCQQILTLETMTK